MISRFASLGKLSRLTYTNSRIGICHTRAQINQARLASRYPTPSSRVNPKTFNSGYNQSNQPVQPPSYFQNPGAYPTDYNGSGFNSYDNQMARMPLSPLHNVNHSNNNYGSNYTPYPPQTPEKSWSFRKVVQILLMIAAAGLFSYGVFLAGYLSHYMKAKELQEKSKKEAKRRQIESVDKLVSNLDMNRSHTLSKLNLMSFHIAVLEAALVENNIDPISNEELYKLIAENSTLKPLPRRRRPSNADSKVEIDPFIDINASSEYSKYMRPSNTYDALSRSLIRKNKEDQLKEQEQVKDADKEIGNDKDKAI